MLCSLQGITAKHDSRFRQLCIECGGGKHVVEENPGRNDENKILKKRGKA